MNDVLKKVSKFTHCYRSYCDPFFRRVCRDCGDEIYTGQIGLIEYDPHSVSCKSFQYKWQELLNDEKEQLLTKVESKNKNDDEVDLRNLKFFSSGDFYIDWFP
jgi:hypothetical protein